MRITFKEARHEFGIYSQLLHAWKSQGLLPSVIRVGQGGHPKKSGAGGRLTYHNTVLVSDLAPLVKRYHATTKRGGRKCQTAS